MKERKEILKIDRKEVISKESSGRRAEGSDIPACAGLGGVWGWRGQPWKEIGDRGHGFLRSESEEELKGGD